MSGMEYWKQLVIDYIDGYEKYNDIDNDDVWQIVNWLDGDELMWQTIDDTIYYYLDLLLKDKKIQQELGGDN